MPDLYDAVGHGMWAYSHAAFRVRRARAWSASRSEPGTLIVVTHRRETDVPGARAGRSTSRSGGTRSTAEQAALRRAGRHVPAGVLRRLPAGARRCARGGCSTRSASPAGLAARERLPDPERERRAAGRGAGRPSADAPRRAPPGRSRRRLLGPGRRAAGSPPPVRAGDVLRGGYADLLWQAVARRRISRTASRTSGARGRRGPPPTSARSWRSCAPGRSSSSSPRAARPPTARSVRSGRASARSSAAAARAAVRPLALAYDPLVRGRTRVHLALGEPVEPPGEDVEEHAPRGSCA